MPIVPHAVFATQPFNQSSVEITIDILIADVSSGKETVLEGRGRILLVVPVSVYHVCATRQQFTVVTVACL